MVPLALVNEVRPASALDPTTVGKHPHPLGLCGTETLRKSPLRLHEIKLMFSLVLGDRTIDIQASSMVEAEKLQAACKYMVDQARRVEGVVRPSATEELV
mmetsp:Transcript_6245/g.19570  ORF Transcript_6245/g.19570 Transcript_6245/m.19570 type:complete len:100 (+) Transcript_6245:2-301(+)